jgi:hypothetical protein
VTSRIVHEEQIGFIQSKFILHTIIFAWETMKWARETRQDSLFIKIDFDKAYERVDWSFVTKMLQCLIFGSNCVVIVNTLFSNVSTLVYVNNTLTIHIPMHRSIRQGYPLAPSLYVLVVDAPRYLLESARIQGRIEGISLSNRSKMVNNDFVDDSFLNSVV